MHTSWATMTTTPNRYRPSFRAGTCQTTTTVYGSQTEILFSGWSDWPRKSSTPARSNDVYCNLSTGFEDGRHAVAVRPARFRSVDAGVVTGDGLVTRACDPAVPSVDRNRAEVVKTSANGNGKLFDLVWRAADPSYRNARRIRFFRNTAGLTELHESRYDFPADVPERLHGGLRDIVLAITCSRVSPWPSPRMARLG